jgi:hypothetical protein
MVGWYKHDIPAWMDGTEALGDGPYRAYHVICQLIYLNEGPIALNEHGIAGRCHQHILAFRRHLKSLLDDGKLVLIDGRLSNDRAATELQLVNDHRTTSGKGGRNSRGVTKGSSVDKPDNILKDKATASSPLLPEQHHKTRLEETREEKKDAAPAALDPEVELFRRGRQVLGKQAGGLISKLLTAKQKNIALARAAIEQASTKSDPREYIGRIINGQKPGETAWLGGIEGII